MSTTAGTTWANRIEKAASRGGFTDEDVGMAQSWASCAISEKQDALRALGYRFHASGRPVKGSLIMLGVDFYVAIRGNRAAVAARLFEKLTLVASGQEVEW